MNNFNAYLQEKIPVSPDAQKTIHIKALIGHYMQWLQLQGFETPFFKAGLDILEALPNFEAIGLIVFIPDKIDA